MSDTIGKTTAGVTARILEEEKQIRVEGEGSLPDYCDDIHRIVRVSPKVLVHKQEVYEKEGKLVCEVRGNVAFQVICRGEDAGVVLGLFSHTFTEEFSAVFETGFSEKDCDGVHAFFCTPTVISSSCKALSKKKCRFSAAVGLNARWTLNRTLTYFKAPKEGVETLERNTEVTRLKFVRKEEFEICEEISLKADSAPIHTLLDAEWSASPAYVRAGEGTVEFSLSAALSCAYFSEADETSQGSAESFLKPMNITEKLSVEGVYPDSIIELCVLPGAVKAEVLTDAYGMRKSVKISLVYTVQFAVIARETLPLLADAYCLGGDCEMQYETEGLEEILACETAEVPCDVTFSFAEHYSAFEDVHVCLCDTECTVEDGQALLSGTLRFTALGVRAEDARVTSVEESVKVRLPVKLSARYASEEIGVSASGACVRMNLALQESSLLANFVFALVLVLRKKTETTFIRSFSVSERTHDAFCGVRFYYPAPTDSLWEIAKLYGVKKSRLMEQNGMKEEYPLPHMLLIS